MPQIVVDESLRARLNGMTEELTFCDATGKVLGHFIPECNGEDQAQDRVIMLPQDQCPYSEEELKKMRRAKGGMTLKQFWKLMGRQ